MSSHYDYGRVSDHRSSRSSSYSRSSYRRNKAPKATQRFTHSTPIGRAKGEMRITLRKIYVDQIISGAKTVEGRINSGQFKHIKENQIIIFYGSDSEVKCKVIAKIAYTSFGEMLKNEGVEKCLPGVKTLEEGKAIYDAIPGYRERALQNGVVALRLEVIPKEEKKAQEPILAQQFVTETEQGQKPEVKEQS